MCKFFLYCILFLCCTKSVLAVSVTILDYPVSVGEEKFNFTVKVSGASAGTNFLRADLYKEGSKSYFGETDNGQSWYSGSDGKQYFPIVITAAVDTIATVSARLGEPTNVDYPGPGTYLLRVRRYTSSGNQGSEDPTPVSLALTKVWPSPSIAVSPSITPAPTSTPALSPSPSPSPSPIPTSTPKPSVGKSIIPSPSISDKVGTVAGEMIKIDLSSFGLISPSPSDSPLAKPMPTLNYGRAKVVLLFGASLVIFALALFLIFQKTHKPKDDSLL